MPNYTATFELNALINRMQIWIKHEQQPQAYGASAWTLEEMAAELTRIAKETPE